MARFILSAFADEAGDSLAEQIAALKENGIRYIEPRNIDKKGILTLSDEELAEVRRALDENGISVYSLGSPIGKYKIELPFEDHLKDFRRALAVCRALDAKNMRMFSFFVSQDEIGVYRDEVIRRLSVMLEEAEAAGIRLCHENESNIYGQMPEQVAQLIDALPSLYAIFDGANYRMHDADCQAGIEATLKRLGYLHIKDAIYESRTIVAAGEGEANIPEVLARVDGATDDLITLTIEPHLALFTAYKSIDTHELAGKDRFSTQREAFDYAVSAIKGVLSSLGFKEGKNGIWEK